MCMICNNSGWIVAVHRINNYIYSFRSDCDIARQRGISEKISGWKSAYTKTYLLDTDRPLAIEAPKEIIPEPVPEFDF